MDTDKQSQSDRKDVYFGSVLLGLCVAGATAIFYEAGRMDGSRVLTSPDIEGVEDTSKNGTTPDGEAEVSDLPASDPRGDTPTVPDPTENE